ncbi:MAG: LysM peptidoglycan-binding domain-containing protein [Victivallales bacterium]|nr:LysM peptidoglycan-binding domain-containing protein [Victivallales bacterium]
MKSGKFFIYGGSAALLAITTLSGCQSPQVLQQRAYIPAPVDQPQPLTEATTAPVVTPAPSSVATPPAPITPITGTITPLKPAPAVVTLPKNNTPVAPKAGKYPKFQYLPSATAVNGAGKTYTVVKGDSLWRISKHYGVSIDDLAAYNNLSKKDKLQVGQTLRLPPGALNPAKMPAVRRHSVGKKVSDRKKTVVAAAKKAEPKTDKKVKAVASDRMEKEVMGSAGGNVYVVKKGDFWGKIARKYHVTSAELAEANNMKTTDVLQIGKKLTIPAGKGKAVVDKAVKEADKNVTSAPESDIEDTGDAAVKDAAKAPEGGKDAVSSADDLLKAIPDDTVKATDALAGSLDNQTAKVKNVGVTEDTTVAQFAAQNGIKPEELLKYNPEISSDGKMKKGDIVTIPAE